MKHEAPKQITNLHEMFQMQNYLQTHVYGDGTSPSDLLERIRANYLPGTPVEEIDHSFLIENFKNMHIAITDEFHEALDEVGWKPWASSRHFNEEAVKGELVDAFHFFINMCMLAGVTADDLIEGYVKKSGKNIARQEAGYDGVATKCPACHRALDDEAVKCTKNEKEFWCDHLKHGEVFDAS